MQRIRLGLLGASFLVLAAAGCLEFDKQTIYFEHDQANDRLIMVVDYGGLYAGKENSRVNLAQAQQQLDESVSDHTAAFFSNFPLLWSSAGTRRQVKDPDQDQDLTPKERDELKRLNDLVTILNAGFYTDPAGRACGAQVVVVEHASEALDLINALLSETFVDAFTEHPENANESVRLLADAGRKGYKWVELDGNSLVVRFPATEDLMEQGWTATVNGVLDEEAGATLPAAVRLRQFLSTPMFLWYENGVVTFKVGLPSRPFTLNSRPRQGDYAPNLVDYIKEKYGFDLDARLARYLQKPDAPAEAEADRAAKLMAPRLTPQQRARVLVEQLQAAPSDALWDLLRKTPTPPAVLLHPDMASNEDLLSGWRRWLKKQAAGPDTEKEREQPERAGTAK